MQALQIGDYFFLVQRSMVRIKALIAATADFFEFSGGASGNSGSG